MSQYKEFDKWEALELLAKVKGPLRNVWVRDNTNDAYKEVSLVGINTHMDSPFVSQGNFSYKHAAFQVKPKPINWTLQSAPKGSILVRYGKGNPNACVRVILSWSETGITLADMSSCPSPSYKDLAEGWEWSYHGVEWNECFYTN